MKYLIYTIGFIYLLISFNYGINIYDEGITLVGGMRVLSGELPIKDFWTIYPPAIFYLSAFLQVISTQIWLHKFVAVIVLFVISLKLNSITNIVAGKKQYFAFVCSIILTGFGIKYLNNSMIGIMLSLFAIDCCIKYFANRNSRTLLYCGIWIGITMLFRHDFAVYLLVAISAIILVERANNDKAKAIAKLTLGFIPLLLVFLLFVVLVGYEESIRNYIVFPLTKFGEVRSIPFPFVWNAMEISDSLSNYFFNVWQSIVFLVPPTLALIGLFTSIKQEKSASILMVSLATLLFYNQALNRSDYAHLIPSLLLSIPLLIVLFARFESRFYRRFSYVLVFIVILLMPIAKKANYAKNNYKDKSLVKSKYDKLEYVYINLDSESRFDLIQELNQNIIKDNTTFLGLTNMENIELNDVLSYYIFDFQPATSFHELHPGVADNPYYQNILLNQLTEKNKYVLLFNLDTSVKKGDSFFKKSLENKFRYIIKTQKYELLSNKKLELPHK